MASAQPQTEKMTKTDTKSQTPRLGKTTMRIAHNKNAKFISNSGHIAVDCDAVSSGVGFDSGGS